MLFLNYFGSKIDLKKAGVLIKTTMPPRKNPKSAETTVVAAAPVAAVVATPAPVSTEGASKEKRMRFFRIVTDGAHTVSPLAGSPAPIFDVTPAEGEAKKRTTDRRAVQAMTPGQAAKKAFTKLVRNAGSPDGNVSYRFSIQEVGTTKVHTYEGSRTLLDVPKSVTRTGKDGKTTDIPIKYAVTVSSYKDGATPKAPRAPRTPKVVEAPVVAAPPVAETAPRGKGKGKGKK